MLLLPENMIESIQKLVPRAGLKITVSPLWGSQNTGHRALLHQEHLRQNPDNSLFHSISHSPGLGILVLANVPVGVDVERSQRVEAPIVARVSSSEELQRAPSPAALWCAKEACFKALRPYNQPSVLSKISVGEWQNIDSQIETFQLLNPTDFNSPSENLGIVIHSSHHSFAFFVFHS